MENTKAIVDTCFLLKLAPEESNIANLKKIIDCLGFQPVAHPYVVEHELQLLSYLMKLVNDGFIRKIEYPEFIRDADDCLLYESRFRMLHEEMRLRLDAKNGAKKIEKLYIPEGQTIFNTHKKGNSMADVHMILMAAELRLPVILTEDSDISLLKGIATEKTMFDGFSVTVYDGLELLTQIADLPKTDAFDLTRKELKQSLRIIGATDSEQKGIMSLWDASK